MSKFNYFVNSANQSLSLSILLIWCYFHKCNASLTSSRLYLKLSVRMSNSVRQDIKMLLPCQSPSTKSVQRPIELMWKMEHVIVWRIYS